MDHRRLVPGLTRQSGRANRDERVGLFVYVSLSVCLRAYLRNRVLFFTLLCILPAYGARSSSVGVVIRSGFMHHVMFAHNGHEQTMRKQAKTQSDWQGGGTACAHRSVAQTDPPRGSTEPGRI